jgi:hypothetical protein
MNELDTDQLDRDVQRILEYQELAMAVARMQKAKSKRDEMTMRLDDH